jgi:hypothetical protein
MAYTAAAINTFGNIKEKKTSKPTYLLGNNVYNYVINVI